MRPLPHLGSQISWAEVEAQQRNIITFGSDARDIPVKQDKHVNEVHRVLRRMYEEQGVVGRNEVTRQAAE